MRIPTFMAIHLLACPKVWKYGSIKQGVANCQLHVQNVITKSVGVLQVDLLS